MRDERGQAVVLIAAALATLILGVGIAVDTGTLYVARRHAQIAADAAAWAGAVVLYSGGSAAAAESAAIVDASRNGYTIGAEDVDVPPTGGPVAGDASFAEVRISQAVETAFFRGPAGGLSTVSVRAVAGATRSGSGEAVLVLRSTNTADTLRLQNNASLAVTGGGIHVNSTNSGSINIDTGTITAPYTRTRGNVTPGDAGKITPAATVNHPTLVADPFANLPGPSTGGLPAFGAQDLNNVTATLNPGIYSGGIRIRGTSVVTLNPGTYILLGGGSDFGFTVQNSAQVLMASPTAGVLLFNTYATYPAAPGGSPNCGQIELDTTGAVTLRARNAGTYAGMVVYQDRSCPTSDEVQIRSTGARTIGGTIYVANSDLRIRGASTKSLTAQLVARQLILEDDGNVVNLTFSPGSVAGGRVPALYE